MARLNWGATAERFYETGIDRGVLYTGNGIGVPWNGLTSVSESPTGGEAKPAYIDGYKFRNVASSEEYEATIEAFSSPKEFGPCDGSRSIHNGLIATQQPRQAFNFSYRTLVGNPIEGTDYGYKIHLVYNALAGPAQRSNGTVSDSIEASKLSWSVTTLPPSLTGMKPTAHFIIDTRETPRGLLAAIEDILYGTDVNSARMPLVSELVAMFQSEGPVLQRNLLLNPTFRKGTATAEVRRNAVLDPKFATTSSNWVGVSAGGVPTAQSIYSNNKLDAAGATWTASMDITAPAGSAVTGTIAARGTAGAAFGAIPYTSKAFTVPAGTTQRVTHTGTIGAGGDGLRLHVNLTSTIATGTIFANADLEKAGADLGHLDGSMAAQADTGWTYSWTGAENASESILSAPQPDSNNATPYAPIKGGRVDGDTLRMVYKGDAVFSLWAFQAGATIPSTTGDKFAAIMQLRKVPNTGNAAQDVLVSPRLGEYVGLFKRYLTEGTMSVTLPADGSWLDVDMPSADETVDAAGSVRVMLYQAGIPAVGTRIEMRWVRVDKVADIGDSLVGGYFDGSTPDQDNNFYSWVSTADSSVSQLNTWN